MLFDKLCKLAERHMPDMVDDLKICNLFFFEGIPHNILKPMFKGKTAEDVDMMCQDFFLPYQVIAVEDGASLVVLKDYEEGVVGINKPRIFMELVACGRTNQKYFEFKVPGDVRKEASKVDMISITSGIIRIDNWNVHSFGIAGDVILSAAFDYRTSQMVEPNLIAKFGKEFIKKHTLNNVSTAINEVLYFNQPDKFILQKRPAKQKYTKGKKIPRSHQRPIYTILHPGKIREKMGIENPVESLPGAMKQPHERRRHTRYLSAERYRYDADSQPIEPKRIISGSRAGQFYYKKVDVPATWVGTAEKKVGNKIYKVILDR